MKSTLIEWTDAFCIGSCIAPVLSDLFLSRVDNVLAADLSSTNVVKVLLILECDMAAFAQESKQVLALVEK